MYLNCLLEVCVYARKTFGKGVFNLKRKIFFIALFFLLCNAVFASDTCISDFKIEGLRKTKESYVQEVLKDFIGKSSNQENLNKIETTLRATNLFSQIKVEAQSDIVIVNLKEKVTLIPLPFASYSNDGFLGGAFLMNMNAGGKANSLIVGGVLGAKVKNAIFMYSKPANAKYQTGYSFNGSFSYKESKFTNYDNEEFKKLKCYTYSAGAGLNHKLTDTVKLSEKLNFSFVDVSEQNDKDVFSISLKLTPSYSTSEWNGTFIISNNVNLSMELGYSSEDEFETEFSLNANYEFAPLEKLKLGCSFSGLMEANKNLLFKEKLNNVGSNIVNSNFRSEKMLVAKTYLEYAAFKSKIGIFSLYGNYEFNLAEDTDKEIQHSNGINGGLKVYLEKFAVPAFMFGFSYNFNLDKTQFVVSLGVGM